ncbi:MAG: isochorismatase family protein [Firmicutes bacterium]|nr:isochorismatase family protein [Bacillota bacterium]
MSNLADSEKAVLVVMDMQEKVLSKLYDREKLVINVLKLVELAKILNIPIIATEHNPRGLGFTEESVMNAIPRFLPVEKNTYNCFANIEFANALQAHKRYTLILTGIEAHVTVCQTALEAFGRYGGASKYKVFIPADAVSSRNRDDKTYALDRLRNKGAEIVTTEMLIFELLKESGTEEFKQMLNHIKKKPLLESGDLEFL